MTAAQVTMRHGVVAVYRYGTANSRAMCSCGWAGPRRLVRAGAYHDAWTHFARTGCQLASPLVRRLTGRP
jgi:hypothetical protein